MLMRLKAEEELLYLCILYYFSYSWTRKNVQCCQVCVYSGCRLVLRAAASGSPQLGRTKTEHLAFIETHSVEPWKDVAYI